MIYKNQYNAKVKIQIWNQENKGRRGFWKNSCKSSSSISETEILIVLNFWSNQISTFSRFYLVSKK